MHAKLHELRRLSTRRAERGPRPMAPRHSRERLTISLDGVRPVRARGHIHSGLAATFSIRPREVGMTTTPHGWRQSTDARLVVACGPGAAAAEPWRGGRLTRVFTSQGRRGSERQPRRPIAERLPTHRGLARAPWGESAVVGHAPPPTHHVHPRLGRQDAGISTGLASRRASCCSGSGISKRIRAQRPSSHGIGPRGRLRVCDMGCRASGWNLLVVVVLPGRYLPPHGRVRRPNAQAQAWKAPPSPGACLRLVPTVQDPL